jgi:hypothetical protein
MNNKSILASEHLMPLLFAVLVHRLGGTVKIGQEDIDLVAYNTLNEKADSEGSIEFCLTERQKTS